MTALDNPVTPPASAPARDPHGESAGPGASALERSRLSAPGSGMDGAGMSRRRPGRPLEMPPDEVLRAIRERAHSRDGLFRIHLQAPGLYARARRLFGAWSEAVRRAGFDYEALQGAARARSLATRRLNRRRALAARRASRRSAR